VHPGPVVLGGSATGAGEIQLNINGQTERFASRPKVEQCSQIKAFNQKKSEKEQEKPSTPTIDILAELLEQLRIDREIRVHNYRNARRRILRREFEESEAKSDQNETRHQEGMAEKSVFVWNSIRRRQQNPRYGESRSGLKTRAITMRTMVRIHSLHLHIG
jgi:hypothetical protein